jgi:glutamine synthetase type III
MQRIFIKIFRIYDGKCLSRKAVHKWVEIFRQGRSKVANDARLGAEVAETTVRRVLCYEFRSTGKAIGQVYTC